MIPIAERLKWSRISSGLSLPQAAKVSGFHVSFLRQIEDNEIVVSYDVIDKLGEIYGIRTDWIMTGEEKDISSERIKVDFSGAPDPNEVERLKLFFSRLR